MMMSWVYLPSLVMICQRAAETHVKREELKHIFINYGAPYRSKVTKLFGCPHDDAMGVFTKFGYDMLKCCLE